MVDRGAGARAAGPAGPVRFVLRRRGHSVKRFQSCARTPRKRRAPSRSDRARRARRVAPGSSNSRSKYVFSALCGKRRWIVSRCEPVMAKMWVARSTSVAVSGWLRSDADIDPAASANFHRMRLGGCPRTACTPADATSISLRLPTRRRNSPRRWGCGKCFRYRQKGRFSRCERDASGRESNVKLNALKSTPPRVRSRSWSMALPAAASKERRSPNRRPGNASAPKAFGAAPEALRRASFPKGTT